MKKIVVKFPAGAGGHWLRHVCYCLENNIDDAPTNNDIHFHNKSLSKNVIGDHFYINTGILSKNVIGDYQVDNYDILLSSTCKFSLYLNAVIKNENDNIPNNWFENAGRYGVNYISSSRYHMSQDWEQKYENNIDLDISLTSRNPKKFVTDLFTILEKLNFKFKPNENLLYSKMKQFVKTCPNPYNHIGDLNNGIWQVWCLGFLKPEELLLNYDNMQQVINQIKQKNDDYIKITKQWIF